MGGRVWSGTGARRLVRTTRAASDMSDALILRRAPGAALADTARSAKRTNTSGAGVGLHSAPAGEDRKCKELTRQEIISFPKPNLPTEIETMLRAHQNSSVPHTPTSTLLTGRKSFPSATENPSLHPLMDEGPLGTSRPSERPAGAVLAAGLGQSTRMRIPIENR